MDPIVLFAAYIAATTTMPLTDDHSNYIVRLRAEMKPVITSILKGQQRMNPKFLPGFDPEQFEQSLFTK